MVSITWQFVGQTLKPNTGNPLALNPSFPQPFIPSPSSSSSPSPSSSSSPAHVPTHVHVLPRTCTLYLCCRCEVGTMSVHHPIWCFMAHGTYCLQAPASSSRTPYSRPRARVKIRARQARASSSRCPYNSPHEASSRLSTGPGQDEAEGHAGPVGPDVR